MMKNQLCLWVRLISPFKATEYSWFGLAIVSTTLLFNFRPAAAQTSEGYYLGTIAGKYKIQMQIQSGFDEGLTRWWGTYFYELSGEPISLTGREDGDSIILDESVGGEKTGIFRGAFSGNRFEGTWTNPKTHKQMPFSVQQTVLFETMNENKEGWIIHFNYPKFTNGGRLAEFINESIYSSTLKAFKSCADDFNTNYESDEMRFEANRRYSIRFVHDHLISSLIERWEFTGGAHGDLYFEVLNAGYVNGTPKILTLEDLFIRESDYKRVLSAAGIELLRSAEAYYIIDGTITELNERLLLNFTVTPKGLSLHYAPYEVGPYAGGPTEITIPWKKLESIVNRDGPLAPILPKKK